MWLQPRKTAPASGLSSPWVSEMTPTRNIGCVRYFGDRISRLRQRLWPSGSRRCAFLEESRMRGLGLLGSLVILVLLVATLGGSILNSIAYRRRVIDLMK